MRIPARAFSPFLAAVLLVVGACGGDAPEEAADDGTSTFVGACNDRAVIGGDRVGPLRVGEGARMRRLPTSCAARETTFTLTGGVPETGFVVDMGNVPVIAVTTNSPDSSVSRVIITQPGLRTANGLTVGSTMAELRQKGGRICGEFGTGLVGVWSDSVPGAVFAMSANADSLKLVEEAVRHDAAPISDTARVVSIWILGGPMRCASR